MFEEFSTQFEKTKPQYLLDKNMINVEMIFTFDESLILKENTERRYLGNHLMFDTIMEKPTNVSKFLLCTFELLSENEIRHLVSISTNVKYLKRARNKPKFFTETDGMFYFNTDENDDDETARFAKFRDDYLADQF